MKMKLDKLEEACEFVSFVGLADHDVIIRVSTGEFFYISETADHDELPPDADESDDFIRVPSFTELGLGTNIVRSFVEEHMPEHRDRIRSIFSRRGAYSRFKELLVSVGKLEAWNDFESEKKRNAIQEWCGCKGIEVEEPG